MINRILLFGDSYGIPHLLAHIPYDKIVGIVVASARETDTNYVVRPYASNIGIDCVVQPKKTDDLFPSFVDTVRSIGPELIFVHSYSMKIPPEILEIPKYGAINIHYSPLPKYRGANPIQWAIINGETQHGTTIHYMTDNIDAGDIIAQKKVPIGIRDTWIDVNIRCRDATSILLSEEIPKILTGTNTRTVQAEWKATKFGRRTEADGEFTWDDSPTNIYNKIRALVTPLPGAFYYDLCKRKKTIDKFVPFEWVESYKKAIEDGLI